MKKNSSTNLKYNFLLESSREIILFFDKNGKIIDCNKAAIDILGYDDDNDEIYELIIQDIFRDAISIKNNNFVVNSKYNNIANEAIAYKKNQTCLTVELKIVLTEDSKHFMGLCIASDISVRKKLICIIKHLKNDIKNILENKNRFIANITHELRTPVNGIMGMSEILLEMELDLEEKDTINTIHQCCMNMNSLINDLLDVVKMRSNKIVLEERAFNFRAMIDNIVKLNIKQINEKRLNLILNIAKDVPKFLIGDELRLTQIINNLFANAIKFTNIGEIILDISVTDICHNEIELFIMVIDTGIGINPEEKDKLFLSFYQVDSSITRKFGGTGLGLSICQMLADVMGGKIDVESEIGKGSTFSFSVRLMIPCGEKDIFTRYSVMEEYDQIEQVMEGEAYINVEEDYVDVFLNDTIHTFDIEDGQLDNNDKSNAKNEVDSSGQYILQLIEKLIFTIELEGWKQAEQLALLVRDIISKEYKSIKNKALRLLFSIRKEDREISIIRAKELERILNEVI